MTTLVFHPLTLKWILLINLLGDINVPVMLAKNKAYVCRINTVRNIWINVEQSVILFQNVYTGYWNEKKRLIYLMVIITYNKTSTCFWP